MFKKVMAVVLAAVLVGAGFAGCGAGEGKPVAALVLAEQEFLNNNNFLLSAWDGIERYSQEADLGYAYYESEIRQEAAQEVAVAEAIDKGAEIIVMPGYLLEPTALKVQDEYSDTHFVLVDGVPNNADFDNYVEHVADNTYALMYAEEEAGFLAGYAAVTDGFRKLGFFGGMSVPTVTRFGYGYLQGAEYAAEEQGLDAGALQVRYLYCGAFTPSPEYQAKAASWYWDGTEVIFACGGAMGSSVMAAAEESGEDAWVIGVDTDQSEESDRVIASAVKMVSDSVYDVVKAHFEGGFPGGERVHLGIDRGGVGLMMDTARFENFSEAQYNAIYEKLAADESGITSNILKDDVAIEDLPLPHIDLQYETLV